MKTPSHFLAVLTVLAFSFAPGLVRAQDAPPPPPPGDQGDQSDQGDQGASFQTFYDQLGSQGNWVQTDDYGYVFQPSVSDPDWAPYTDGYWANTDDGLMWVSDEPWGWATYHYGRWINIDGTGWVWVPGYRWGPAWVSWRYGGGYCGWAPLPPETLMGAEYGEPGVAAWGVFHFGGDVDVSFNIGPGCYNFVRVGDMGERNYRGHFLDRSSNYAVINNTTNVTNINITNGSGGAAFQGVVANGPPVSELNAHSHQHIQTVHLTAANRPGESQLHGNSLAVYAPRVNGASIKDARPAKVSQTIAHPTFNRGDSITKPLAVTASVKPPPPSSAAILAAQTAQLHAPAKAKVATEHTTVKTPLTTPLTSLAPVAPVHHTTGATGNSFNGANTEHSAANAPFTGEPVKKPSVTQPNEAKPTPVYHPQTEVYPQTEAKPSLTQPNEVKPTPVYHPQTESSGNQVFHPSNTPPTETYHPQTENSGSQTFHPSNTPPTETYHPQQQQQQPRPQQQQSHQSQPNYKPGNTNNAPGH